MTWTTRTDPSAVAGTSPGRGTPAVAGTPPGPGSSLRASLPGSAYTDPAVFTSDTAAVLATAWHCVGRSDAASGAGDFLRVDVAGRDVLLVRGRDRRLRGFANLCRHRGSLLCTQASGSVGRAIRCGYHAWTYALDGRLVAAPNMAEMPDLDKREHGLLTVRVAEWLGYAWVALDARAGELADQVEPQLRERLGDTATLRRYAIGDLVVARTIDYDVASNWKAIVENFMECYHCATIHPELTDALPQFASGYGTVSGGVGAGARLAADRQAFSASGRATRPRLPGLLARDDRLFYGIVLRPNAFLILAPDHVLVFRMQPLAADRTRVVVDWLFDPEQVAREDFDPEDTVQIMDVTNRQDFAACERCQQGMRSPDYRGVLVPAEHVVAGFHDWYRAALAAGAGPVAS